jgi:hypothetical protein
MLAPSRTVHYEVADASLLALTPALSPQRSILADFNWEQFRNVLEQRLYGLRSWRYSWWAHWALLAEYILPRRYHWLITPNQMVRGNPINQAIVDPTGTQALRICSAGLMNGLMSPSDPWFKLSAGEGFEVDFEAQQWLDVVEERIYTVMEESNFYKAAAQMFEDLPVFGTAPMLIYEHPKEIIRCYNPCAGEYFLANGADFAVNTFERTFVLTTIQLVEMFGLENCGPDVQQLWNSKGANLETEWIVAHAIEPNYPTDVPGFESKKMGVVAGGFAYREVYWLWGRNSPKPLSVRGFREFPVICPRWATTSNDAYGRSCGMDALPDIMQLQVMTRRLAEAIEKMVRPPVQADAELKNQPSSTLPGKITYVKNVAEGGIKPIYTVDPKVNEMMQLIEKIQERIQRWFFNDIFMAITNMQGVQPRNEFEIAERKAERLQVLGPVIENFQNEGASKAIQRIFAILKRRNMVPPMPQSLRNVPIDIQYISKLALAQKAGATAAMEQGMRVGAQLSQLFPQKPPLDNVDGDVYFRQYLERIGFPSKPIVSTQQRDQQRKARDQAVAQAHQQQQMAAAAPVAGQAADAAKTLSDTDVGQGQNALQLMLGNRAGVPLQ